MTKRTAITLIIAATVCGCASKQSAVAPPRVTTPPGTQSSARNERATTQPSQSTASGRPPYWLRQPAVATVRSNDFDALWSACEEAARHFGFVLDREDYRAGVITTDPLTSKQFFELWRNDVATVEDLANSSLATYRRTLRFDIDKEKSGGYVAAPRVVIERYSRSETPISASVYLRNAFRTQRDSRAWGNRETDRGVQLPRQYWYATGRDEAIEKQVAAQVSKRLARR
jgi:hypothetical protein